jgi:glucose-6-phosphate 1-epimerase
MPVDLALPSSVRAEPGAGGLPRLAIQSRHGTAEMYFHGAHLTAWQPATASAPVLWVSRESVFAENKAIRGGVPICFPWFGPNAADPKAPAHGFARLRPWKLLDAQQDADGIVSITMRLESPETFQAQYRVEIGPSLTMQLQIHNPAQAQAPFTFEEALHTYFAVQDVRNVRVSGLEDTEYLDKVAGFERRRQPQEPIRFTGETDRVYLNTRATCVIHDVNRTITISKTGSDTTVVWNPWIDKARAMPDFGDDEWPEMVCVETCNVGAYARTLAPGESHTMTAIIAVS